MTVESMLRLIAGVLVAASILLGMYVHPYLQHIECSRTSPQIRMVIIV